MSTSAEKRARKKRRQRGQLMFLIHAMSIDDLIKYGLMKEEDRPDRPDDKELLRNLDDRIAQFWQAHQRITKGTTPKETVTLVRRHGFSELEMYVDGRLIDGNKMSQAEINQELRVGRTVTIDGLKFESSHQNELGWHEMNFVVDDFGAQGSKRFMQRIR